MHLTTDHCADRVVACAISWLFTTKTAFYAFKDWNLPWFFGVLCFSYSLFGLVLLLTKRPNRLDNFPRYLYALHLILIQGSSHAYITRECPDELTTTLQAPLSFMADYVNMDQDSIFHVLDRFAALTSAMLELCRIFDLLHIAKPSIATLYVGISVAGVLSFLRSQEAQAIQDRDNFVLFHNLWHV